MHKPVQLDTLLKNFLLLTWTIELKMQNTEYFTECFSGALLIKDILFHFSRGHDWPSSKISI